LVPFEEVGVEDIEVVWWGVGGGYLCHVFPLLVLLDG